MNTSLLSTIYHSASNTQHRVSELLYNFTETTNSDEREQLLGKINNYLGKLHQDLDDANALTPFIDVSNLLPISLSTSQAEAEWAMDNISALFESFRFKLVKQLDIYSNESTFALATQQEPLKLVKNDANDEYYFSPTPLPVGPKSYLTKVDAWVHFFTFLSLHPSRKEIIVEPSQKKDGLTSIREYIPLISTDNDGKTLRRFLGFPAGTLVENINTSLNFLALE